MPTRIWYNCFFEARERQFKDFTGEQISIGRGPHNDLQLEHPQVPESAAVLTRNGNGWAVNSQSYDWVEIDSRKLKMGESVGVSSQQILRIFPFTLSITFESDGEGEGSKWEKLDTHLATFLRELHRQLLNMMGSKELDRKSMRDAAVMQQFEQDVEGLAESLQLFTPQKAELMKHAAGHAVRNRILWSAADAPAGGEQRRSTLWTDQEEPTDLVSMIPEREQELEKIADFLLKRLKSKPAASEGQFDSVEHGFWPAWEGVLGRLLPNTLRYLSLKNIKKEIKDSVFGYGPLEDLLRTPAVTEIMVVDSTRIYIERDGRVEKSGRRFVSDEVTESIIQRIVGRVGRRIDRSSPLVDARLSDGSRVNAVIPPISVKGPCLTIRKFAARKLGMEDLIRVGALTDTVAQFLNAAVQSGANILVSGGTGTGKTTLLNCLSDYIPNEERIVTIEDTAELRMKKDHVVSLETKDANVEDEGGYTIRDLVRNALRMRPNRIIVGECRGPEALDMLQAMNTGHSGSMTTIHANTADDAVSRLEVLVALAADLPIESIRQQIVAAIDVIVQLQRTGRRRLVTQIAEVVEVDTLTGRIRTKDLFKGYRRTESPSTDTQKAPATKAPNGDIKASAAKTPAPESIATQLEESVILRPTGQLPTFMDRLIAHGYLNLDTFY